MAKQPIKKPSKREIARDRRIARASVIIKANPKWGRDRINAQLKQEFGIGLRKLYVNRLKRDILELPPSRIVSQATEYTTKPPRIPFFVDVPGLAPSKKAKRIKVAMPIHRIGSMVRECYAVIELVLPIFSQDKETRFITIALGLQSYTSFLTRLRAGVFRRRIERIVKQAWGVDVEGYRIMGYWAHRYSETERRGRIRRQAPKLRLKGRY